MSSDIERFLSKVQKTDTCWIYTGGIGNSGYGQFSLFGKDENKNVSAHRYSYVIHKGIIPKGMLVCHSCNNKQCVNPEHLFLGTYRDNHLHSIATGIEPKKDQRFGRKQTASNAFPKGISFDASRINFRCSIRVGDKRYLARKNTLEEAIKWRTDMENKYWKSELVATEGG